MPFDMVAVTFINHAARRTFYLSIIQSTLDYASISYVHSLSQSLYDRLTATSHKAMKKIINLDRFTPTSLVLSRGNLYTLESRYQLKLYVFAYRCLHGLASSLLSDIIYICFTCRGFSHCCFYKRAVLLRSCASLCTYTVWFHIYFFPGADRWNSLPLECRQACSIPEFVSHVKLYLGFPGKKT